MTTRKAIEKAMSVFAKANIGDLRTIELWEMDGSDNKCDYVLVRVGYSVDGDYTESEKTPFLVSVRELDGKISTRMVD